MMLIRQYKNSIDKFVYFWNRKKNNVNNKIVNKMITKNNQATFCGLNKRNNFPNKNCVVINKNYSKILYFSFFYI